MNSEDLRQALSRIGRAVRVGSSRGPLRVFEHLGITSYEPAHSRLLAWLLNPAESHGLGDAFLKGFWQCAFPEEHPESYTPARVTAEEDLGGARPDIVVRGPSWRLIIEVKLRCQEHDDQTLKYAELSPGAKCVYLTIAGDCAQSRNFTSVRWSDVRRLLDACPTGGEAEWLLRQFADHIARNLEV
jgi:hypothetical protein